MTIEQEEVRKRLKYLSRAYLDAQKYRCSYDNRLGSVGKLFDGEHVVVKNKEGEVIFEEQLLEPIVSPRDFDSWKIFFDEHVSLLKNVEVRIQDAMKKELKEEPLWTEWLIKVKGVGPVIASSVIGEIGDIHRFDKTSNLWSYAGLSVVNGKAKKRTRGEKANWNQNLRLALWKFGESIIKQKNARYRDFYDTRKAYEQENHPDLSKGHIHNRTLRYVEKKFLSDLKYKWLEIE